MAETTAESQLAHAFNQRLVWHETRRQAMPKSSHLYGSAGSMTYGVGAAANADLGRACKQDVIIQWNGSYSVKQHSCIYNFTLYIYILDWCDQSHWQQEPQPVSSSRLPKADAYCMKPRNVVPKITKDWPQSVKLSSQMAPPGDSTFSCKPRPLSQ